MECKRLIKYGCNRGILFSICLSFIALSAVPVYSAATAARGPETTRAETPEAPSTSIEVFLSGVYSYEVTLAFDRILQQVPGIGTVRRVSMQLVSDSPLESRVIWAVDSSEIPPPEVEEFVFHRLRTLAAATEPEPHLLDFEPTRNDRAVLSEIFPWKATSRTLYFARFTPGGSEAYRYGAPAGHGWLPGKETGFE
jgi:hypothetical protein